MKKEIILGVIIIFLIIIISYRHVPINSNSNTNDDFIEEENPYTYVWDLIQYPKLKVSFLKWNMIILNRVEKVGQIK